MCGIAGEVSVDGTPIDWRWTSGACGRLTHRGPDDAGLWESQDRSTVLGHRRLSIIDLSPLGHNPMPWDDGRLWITFNGEIYNFLELRQELESAGL